MRTRRFGQSESLRPGIPSSGAFAQTLRRSPASDSVNLRQAGWTRLAVVSRLRTRTPAGRGCEGCARFLRISPNPNACRSCAQRIEPAPIRARSKAFGDALRLRLTNQGPRSLWTSAFCPRPPVGVARARHLSQSLARTFRHVPLLTPLTPPPSLISSRTP